MPGGNEDRDTELVPGPPVRRFTWKELSQLNTRENAHVAYRGKVYDVSSFVSRHPGGLEQILLGAGRDITQLFESYHKTDTFKNVLEKYYVGELIDNEMPVFPERGEFYVTLKKRVETYFKENNIDPKVDYWMFFRYFLFFVLLIFSQAMVIYFQDSWILGITCSFFWGFFSALVAMTCTHDSSHFAITHKPWVWKMVGHVHDFYQGCSLHTWIYQHTLGHHPYTNIDGADPDIVTAASDVPDIRRIKWQQKWLPRYFYQHVYVPMLYCFLGIKTRLQDFHIVFTKRNSTIRLNPLILRQWLILFAGKISHCIIRFYIPSLFMPLSSVLFYNLIAEMSGSYWLALIFQTSHVISEVEWPKPDKDNKVHMDWAELQVATTQDYATDSWFWTVFTGALNHQTTHHLFPGVIQSHYRLITPIIKKTCEEFGIKYHYVDTTKEALGCHLEHLRRLGQEEVDKDK
ncbi:PREDICTED: acyl-lipid (8-3)-desaturase-like [Amphimedon queenslandica]|uniref:Cytochrome b5 heme-binding domain-containing protein n=1 Tax=Amphimedon queenslandica TaxID=400682 RepID=A0A1X7V9Y3_AMPQE|nr:PREDICTED: acyl-lipid (8-3)-desaturase-like [Amphimedon queenslandica]|eukprot:XP_019850089.1 PREDICTED: acyl-lipid (8-3)-desaturase-like [Amphimedon queenslandica]